MKKNTLLLFVTLSLLIAGLSSCGNTTETDQQETATSPAMEANETGKTVAAATSVELSEPKPGDAIQWLSWNEAAAAQEQDPKLLLVDVYTDWCKWCKVMDDQTFSDPTVADYINEHFYAVKLNAETENPINFRGQEFKVVAGGRRGIHTLAYALLDGQLSYPSYVYLNENYERMHISKGFKPVDPFMAEVKAIRGETPQ